MLHSYVIATTKRIPIGTAVSTGDVWMPILVTIIDIWAPVVSVVFARPFDAVMKAAAFNLLILRRRRLPGLLRAICIAVTRRRWTLCDESGRDKR